MSTHALVHFHHHSRQSAVILSVFKHFDGYVKDGLGDALQKALKGLKPGFAIPTSCLTILEALRVSDMGDDFEVVSDGSAEYEYHVFRNEDGSVGLTVLYMNVEAVLMTMPPKVYVSFSYRKPDGSVNWREIVLVEEDGEHIRGREVSTGEFRTFLKSRILGGEKGTSRIQEVKQ